MAYGFVYFSAFHDKCVNTLKRKFLINSVRCSNTLADIISIDLSQQWNGNDWIVVNVQCSLVVCTIHSFVKCLAECRERKKRIKAGVGPFVVQLFCPIETLITIVVNELKARMRERQRRASAEETN